MAEEHVSPGASLPRPSFDEQLWPIQGTIVILAGCLAGIALGIADPNDPRLLFNGYTYVVFIAAGAALLLLASTKLKSSSSRSAQFCILLSLMLHAAIACAVIHCPLPLGIIADAMSVGTDETEQPEENIAPDYHWAQAEAPDAAQDFQQPVNTKSPESAQANAGLQPHDADKPTPVSATKPPISADTSTLGASGAAGAGGPTPLQRFEPRRSNTDADVKAKEPETVALLHQLNNHVEAPMPDAQMPDIPKANSREAEKSPQTSSARELAEAIGVLPQQPRPISVARSGNESSQPLPGSNVVALAPAIASSKALPGSNERHRADDSADPVEKPATLNRSDRSNLEAPSSVIADEGLAPKRPAAVGDSPGSRLDKTSAVAVERSANSHAPVGPNIAAAGSQDFGTGSELTPARMGSPDKHGQRRPGSDKLSIDEPADLRFGARNSLLENGAPFPYAAARRAEASQAEASQPNRNGNGINPGESATLKRSQSPDGIILPSAALPAVDSVATGAGGTGTSPGGETSRLELGPVAADMARQSSSTNEGRASSAATVDDNLPVRVGALRSEPVLAMSGVPSGAGRQSSGSPEGDSTGPVPRSQGTSIDPDAKADETTGLQPSPSKIAGANSTDVPPAITSDAVGNDRLPERSHALDLPTPAHHSDTQADSSLLAMLPQTGGPASHRAGGGEGDLGQAATGIGPGQSRLGRNGSGLSLDGAVREPTEFYRRRAAMRHGMGIADGDGSGFTEPAVEHGLDFFSRIQFPDGHWSLNKLPDGIQVDSPGLGSYQSDTAATGMSLLGYLGAGYTHLDEKHRDVVRRGLEWMIRHQKPNGSLFTGGNDNAAAYAEFYSHGIATIALCEAYGMTQDPDLRVPAQKAVDYIVRSQDPIRGGWRYHPGEGSDTSVTGWQLMAMKSAQMAGLDVPDATFRHIGEWLDRAKVGDTGTYVYNPWNLDNYLQHEGRMPSPTMTAEAMLMRMYMGRHRDDAEIVRGADYILANLPEVGTRERPQRNAYYWYYATQTMFQMGGNYWKTWNGRLAPLVRAGQVKDGLLEGSWHPTDPVEDKWGTVGGRVYVTSMHLLMLEVYYRHLPLFQELSK